MALYFTGIQVAFLILVTCIGTTFAQCVRGEPRLGESEPDVNITVLSSTRVQVGDEIKISCAAGTPRFPKEQDRLLPPVRLIVLNGGKIINSTRNPVQLEVIHCGGSLKILSTNGEIVVRCQAMNGNGKCRTRIVTISVRNGTASVITNPKASPTSISLLNPPTTSSSFVITGSPVAPTTTTSLVNLETTALPPANRVTEMPTKLPQPVTKILNIKRVRVTGSPNVSALSPSSTNPTTTISSQKILRLLTTTRPRRIVKIIVLPGRPLMKRKMIANTKTLGLSMPSVNPSSVFSNETKNEIRPTPLFQLRKKLVNTEASVASTSLENPSTASPTASKEVSSRPDIDDDDDDVSSTTPSPPTQTATGSSEDGRGPVTVMIVAISASSFFIFIILFVRGVFSLS